MVTMASTRNKNTPGNYALEQRQLAQQREYWTAHGANPSLRLPGDGLLPARMPSHHLSDNAVNIESFLFGIGSTNLVEPQTTPFHAELKALPSAHCYERNRRVWIPRPLQIDPNQRPLW